MSDWKPIATLPAELKDGRIVMVRRVHERRTIAKGLARWASRGPEAPGRVDPGPDPLNRPNWITETQASRDARCDAPAWVTEDRLHLFPEPTHWSPTA